VILLAFVNENIIICPRNACDTALCFQKLPMKTRQASLKQYQDLSLLSPPEPVNYYVNLRLISNQNRFNMKKIFTSALLFFAVASTAAFAGTPQKVLPRIMEASVDNNFSSANFVEAPKIDRVVADIVDTVSVNDTWATLGIGEFNDVAVSMFINTGSGPWQVEIQQSNEHPGYYRMVNPYSSSLYGAYYSGYYKVREEDTYIVFDATDPNAVKMVTTKTHPNLTDYTYAPLNWKFNDTYGEFGIIFVGDLYSTPIYGTLTSGNIIFNASALRVTLDGYPNNWWTPTSQWKISLPGAQDNAVSVKINNYCYPDNKIPYTVTLGEDVKHVKVGEFPSFTTRYAVNQANTSYTVENGEESSAGEHTFNGNDYKDGVWFTIYGASYDDNGNALEGGCDHAFITQHVDSEWRDLGLTKFVDDTYAPGFLGVTTEDERNVQLLQNKKDPTRFRLVNAFATSSLAGFDAATMYDGATNAHNHYTEIVVYRNDSVVIPERPMGLTIDGDKLSLYSYNAGTLNDDRTITFPSKGLREVTNNLGSYYGNYSNKFSLFIPRYDIIAVVTDANDQPVAGATVKVGDFTATTDEAGTATFSAYGIGTTSATFTATYNDTAADKTRSGSAIVDLEEGNYDLFVPIVLTQETGINDIKVDSVDDANAPVYDLNGRRVSSPAQQGVYIKGGKKVVY
jgi:hypothetical protein